jgi:tetratricopeptide (TPR) repeat protein
VIRRAIVIAWLVAAAACAAKMPPAPPAAINPRYPDYVVPSVPSGVGTPAAVERHMAGWNWLQNGDLRAAERNFAAALKQSASFYPAEVGLGYVALAHKKPKDALMHFDRAVVVNPRYAPALGGRAEALLGLGQEKEAVQSLDAALQADPSLTALRTRIDVLRFRGQQQDIENARKLAQADRFDEARTAYLAAIEASPQSPFLHRELADVERRAGRLDSALQHANTALELEPDEARTHVILGDIYEAQGELAKAADELSAAATLQPDEALRTRIDELRRRAAFDAMPPEYRGIETAPTVTRAQLAALFAVQLEPLLASARNITAIVITDTRGHWAAPYILATARAGVMEIYPNHTFQPDAIVRRVDLARAAGRVLEIIAQRNPQLAAGWRDPRRKFPDVGPGHLNYPVAALAVDSGVMATVEDGSFQLTRPVTGAEAVGAMARLAELAGQQAR